MAKNKISTNRSHDRKLSSTEGSNTSPFPSTKGGGGRGRI
uniref:Uncharacterized protein n=1 Tax=Anguilla anguilla TaxID=7936 RepID=A0A0E9UF54_ANGAN